ncbi:N-acetylglucosamine-1-phosphate uridyltransferase, partial [Burkholderia cenocepacia]|uniref:N-acetylglucosamine-1-phosphate uridyltransferase n=1 Tax=Burkholderia cenocepacia TaxID=95486 RepID=UPI002DDD6A81
MTTFNVMVPVASVLALPFVPMLHELIRRSDVAALPIGDGPFVDQALLTARWHDALRAHVAGTPPADASAVPPWQTLGLAVQHADAIHVARDAHRDDVLYADRTITLDEGAQAAYAFADEHIDIHAGATIGTLAHAPLIDVDDAVLRGVVVGDTVRLRGAGGLACPYGEPLAFGAAPGPRPADTLAPSRRANPPPRPSASLPPRSAHGPHLPPCRPPPPPHTVP